jgi:hypothetical protein
MKIPPRKFSPESVGDGRKTSPVRSETNEGKKTKLKKKLGDRVTSRDARFFLVFDMPKWEELHQTTTR